MNKFQKILAMLFIAATCVVMKTQSTISSGQYEVECKRDLHAANKSKLHDLNKSRKVSQKRL